MREFRPGDKVVSIAVMGLGEGIIFDTHWDGAEVIWSDGKKSTERYEDLIYAGGMQDWKDVANRWVGRNVFSAESINNVPLLFTNQIETMWEQPISVVTNTNVIPIALNVPATYIGYTNVETLRDELRKRNMATYLLEMRGQ